MTNYIIISILITIMSLVALKLEYLSLVDIGRIFGLILIIIGITILKSAIKTLKLNPKSKDPYRKISGLITTGIYSHTRNPMYLSYTITSLGILLIIQIPLILILTSIFIIFLYCIAKIEEKDLHKKYGKEYIEYQKKVSFFIPLQ